MVQTMLSSLCYSPFIPVTNIVLADKSYLTKRYRIMLADQTSQNYVNCPNVTESCYLTKRHRIVLTVQTSQNCVT